MSTNATPGLTYLRALQSTRLTVVNYCTTTATTTNCTPGDLHRRGAHIRWGRGAGGFRPKRVVRQRRRFIGWAPVRVASGEKRQARSHDQGTCVFEVVSYLNQVG